MNVAIYLDGGCPVAVGTTRPVRETYVMVENWDVPVNPDLLPEYDSLCPGVGDSLEGAIKDALRDMNP